MIQAVNSFVFIIQDEGKKENAGLVFPDQGVEKPSHGIIYSVGELVNDKKIKKGKKAIWMKGNGFEITYEEQTYRVLESDRIIGVDE